ncbi:helix-turn-helix domain-containing protein [Aliivibrio finisterrensis]|uniref:DNA-binding protein n=1 Tax=Aliivibrio finisterrensis TaxID=511998 RepID=A0ABY0I9J9_9GAMM|nr:helix-turn-helix domain-containing protein [Aliivibrio finisterrensis]RYU63860.1 hypothetical protein ERW53_11765 [Aliivibrio finisterrensis]RYU82956.1 hypothetical protein ERW52_13870 [Aliivibrio finisterrensis]
MTTSTLVHEATDKYKINFSQKDKLTQALSARLINLMNEVLSGVSTNEEVVQLLAMTDTECLTEVTLKLSQTRARVTQRELEKLQRKLEVKERFYADLRNEGGLYKANEVSKILGVSRQTVNNQREKSKLLAIPQGGDYVYPSFQFTDSGKVPYFEELLNEMKALSYVSQTSFFIDEIEIETNQYRKPIDMLKQGLSQNHYKQLRTQAVLMGKHIAK